MAHRRSRQTWRSLAPSIDTNTVHGARIRSLAARYRQYTLVYLRHSHSSPRGTPTSRALKSPLAVFMKCVSNRSRCATSTQSRLLPCESRRRRKSASARAAIFFAVFFRGPKKEPKKTPPNFFCGGHKIMLGSSSTTCTRLRLRQRRGPFLHTPPRRRRQRRTRQLQGRPGTDPHPRYTPHPS